MYGKVRIYKHLSDAFPFQSDLKQGDALSSLLFGISLEFTILHCKEKSSSWQTNNCSRSQEISLFYGSREIITVFARACHRFLYSAKDSSLHPPVLCNYDPFSYYPPICTKAFQVLSFLKSFPPKPFTHFPSHPFMPHVPPVSSSSSSWYAHPNDVWWRAPIRKLSTMQSSEVLNVRNQLSRQYKINNKNSIIFTFSDRNASSCSPNLACSIFPRECRVVTKHINFAVSCRKVKKW